MRLKFQYDDGGRAAAGLKGKGKDCVCRAISIATERPYSEIAGLIDQYGLKERSSKRRKGKSSAVSGVYSATIRRIMAGLGWTWVPTMKIGQGCKVHLRAGELPNARLVVMVSRHAVAVIDGVIHDMGNPDRFGTRCVYGYYQKVTPDN